MFQSATTTPKPVSPRSAAPSYQGLLTKTELTELTELTEWVHMINGCVQCEAEVLHSLHSSAHKPALARHTSLRFPAFPRSARSLSVVFPRFPTFLHFATFPLCERSALRPVLGHPCTAPMYFSCPLGHCLLVDTLFSIYLQLSPLRFRSQRVQRSP